MLTSLYCLLFDHLEFALQMLLDQTQTLIEAEKQFLQS